jgi:hypothetical protein
METETLMKADPAAIKEIKHISIGVLALDGIVVAVFLGLRILTLRNGLFLLGGSAVAVLGFVWLCISVQKTLEAGENAKGMMTRSYLGRMTMFALWAGFSMLANKGNYPAMLTGLLPLIMPNLTIKIMNLINYLKKEKD